jgi:hypothetical protein
VSAHPRPRAEQSLSAALGLEVADQLDALTNELSGGGPERTALELSHGAVETGGKSAAGFATGPVTAGAAIGGATVEETEHAVLRPSNLLATVVEARVVAEAAALAALPDLRRRQSAAADAVVSCASAPTVDDGGPS